MSDEYAPTIACNAHAQSHKLLLPWLGQLHILSVEPISLSGRSLTNEGTHQHLRGDPSSQTNNTFPVETPSALSFCSPETPFGPDLGRTHSMSALRLEQSPKIDCGHGSYQQALYANDECTAWGKTGSTKESAKTRPLRRALLCVLCTTVSQQDWPGHASLYSVHQVLASIQSAGSCC